MVVFFRPMLHLSSEVEVSERSELPRTLRNACWFSIYRSP
ncbi:hypothetical protein PAHAL_5G049600 [Panicum hallii]|uniref:Uncharacterized protein n=1 Tax=Panicum hallii TaxID=206008 RepID=A0A2T8IJ42_9POAL|nr:hypothetical protein PAHAL_5G049600 [Panicum hallii]